MSPAMVRKACQRAIDENIASLTKEFDQFKVNTPLISVSPLKAYIGLKEGVTEMSKFEVLEAELSKEGKMTYKRVGVIQPKENLIWDNRIWLPRNRLMVRTLVLPLSEKYRVAIFIREC